MKTQGQQGKDYKNTLGSGCGEAEVPLAQEVTGSKPCKEISSHLFFICLRRGATHFSVNAAAMGLGVNKA